jgi:O-antigen ligase/Tfp pilus assembly protein PilF
MAKKNLKKEFSPKKDSIPAAQVAAKTAWAWPSSQDILPIIFCLLYFAVEFLPGFGGIDDMGSQWLYLVLLDLAVAIYILDKKKDFEFAAAAIFKNLFSRLYLALFALAGISVFFSINHTEGWVCYVRFIATIIAFFNLAILLYGRVHLFKILAQVLAIVVLVESFQAVYQFFTEMSNYRLTELILSLKGRAGNKNIFGASLVIKIPFLLYCIYSSKLAGRIFNIAIFVITTLAIFLVNSRTSYLALILEVIIYLFFCFQQYNSNKNRQKSLYRAGYVIIALIAAFFISLVALSAAKSSFQDDSVDANQYGTVTERLASVTSSADDSNKERLFLWGNAVDYFKAHPFMGCGYGNWKIASIPYTKYLVDDLSVPIHAHNDFLEYFAELGVVGGLSYISLFVCLLTFTIKTWFSNTNEETKLVAAFSLIGLAAFFVDAFFNFPIERPVNQLYFVFITALNVVAYQAKKDTANETENAKPVKSSNTTKSIFAFSAILLLLPAAYVTFLTYQSLVVQNRVIPDLNNEPLKLPLKEVLTAFPSIPNLSSSAQPIDAIIGRYLYEAKRYDEAITYLNKGAKANPTILYSEFLKADVYYNLYVDAVKTDSASALKQIDSAFKYASMAYFTKPRAKTYYQTLIAVSAMRKDSATIQKAFNIFHKYRPHESLAWNFYLQGMLNVEMITAKTTNLPLLFLADSALRLFPGDKDLLTRRTEIFTNMAAKAGAGKVIQGNDVILANQYFTEGTNFFNKGDFASAAASFIKSSKISVGTYGVYENIAICYFNLKQWEQSLPYFDKVLSMKTATDGKTEYFKGAALINLGKTGDACPLLKISKAKGYAAADGLITTYCK